MLLINVFRTEYCNYFLEEVICFTIYNTSKPSIALWKKSTYRQGLISSEMGF